MASKQRSVSFLLIEDDDDHADLVSRAMRENRIMNSLDRVADGEEAMAFLTRSAPHEGATRPDVILLDLKLPRMGGHEVLEQIKADPELSTIPVVVMTTSRAESDRVKAYGAHVNSYLVKPVDFERFSEMVRQLELYWSVWNEPPV